MLPQDRRAAVLTHDAALDALVVELYQASDSQRRAALNRAVASKHATLRRILDAYVVAPGDLRR